MTQISDNVPGFSNFPLKKKLRELLHTRHHWVVVLSDKVAFLFQKIVQALDCRSTRIDRCASGSVQFYGPWP